MIALMLAAGVGRRLYGGTDDAPPKVLLEFGGETLLARHIEALLACGISRLVLVLGHRGDEILDRARALAPHGYVVAHHNPRYREAPMISLAAGLEVLTGAEDVLLMDADVLYHPRLIALLAGSTGPACLPFDRSFEPGDEPVKVCLRDGVPVDFGKQVGAAYDTVGEWPGFVRLSAPVARTVAARVEEYMAYEPIEATYEEALRDVLIASPPGTFVPLDVTGIPWVEIDFPEDVERARLEIMPAIRAFTLGSAVPGQTRNR